MREAVEFRSDMGATLRLARRVPASEWTRQAQRRLGALFGQPVHCLFDSTLDARNDLGEVSK